MVLSLTSNMTKDSEEYLEDVSAIRAGNGNGLMGGFLRKQKQASTMALYDFCGTFPIRIRSQQAKGNTRLQGGLSERFRKTLALLFDFLERLFATRGLFL
jgi:hypothetical protein